MVRLIGRLQAVVALGLFLVLMGSVARAQSGMEVKLYLTAESATLYITGNTAVDLSGIGYEIVIDDNRQTFYLDKFASFAPLRFNAVPTPICLRIERTNSTEPLPQNCQEVTTRKLIHAVAQADIFWYDAAARQTRFVLLVQRDNLEYGEFCPPGNLECTLVWPFERPTNATPMPDVTATPDRGIPDGMLGMIGFPVLENREWARVEHVFEDVPMVLVPTGCYLMGDPNGSLDERPIHQQCVDTPFWLDQFEVSNAQYGSYGAFIDPELPRDSLTWYEARDFCESRGGRLPSEMEWEYAARGPDGPVYPWGDTIVEENVTYIGNSDSRPTRVDDKPGSRTWVGAYNMTGNVWEWTSSAYIRSYPYNAERAEDPDDAMSMRVLRGGSWRYEASRVRAAYRGAISPADSYDDSGVRCARDFSPDGLAR